jgi:3-mercaptopyruvate sulfurtransferase SseA
MEMEQTPPKRNPSNKPNEKTIVSVKWLHEHLDDSDLIVLDASQQVNQASGTPISGYQIKAARYFDIKTILATH